MVNNKKGQNIVGFLVLFIVIVAALFVVSKYIRNAMSGKIRQAGDTLGAGAQYDPGKNENYGYYHTGADSDKTAATYK